ncbi:hypothetical protein A1D29_00205 [Pasteurellaceae bacterium Orientalotternb1]|nr:hypothetical protein A1D29_00205 [Pasteurellaceae bacterium Orientalotternb1]
MKLVTVEAHQGEGQFPLFPKGSEVKVLAECPNYQGWLNAKIANYQTYVPKHFIQQNQLVIDYNPTELVIAENEVVELIELHYEWALVQQDSQIGWLPCKILKSL